MDKEKLNITSGIAETDSKVMTMTICCNEIKIELAGTGTATINWGDGSVKTYNLVDCEDDNVCDADMFFHHNYSNETLRTITITGDNVTYLGTPYECELTALDVSKNTSLKLLFCMSNQLTILDVSKNTALKELVCNRNKLTNLDVRNNIALTMLDCSYNELTILDVSNNTALTDFECVDNKLTELDVSLNIALEVLFCGDNQITELDVSKNTALKIMNYDFDTVNLLTASENKQEKENFNDIPYEAADKVMTSKAGKKEKNLKLKNNNMKNKSLHIDSIYLIEDERMEMNDNNHYPFSIPVIRNFRDIKFRKPVTFIIGENGTGKSTLLEAFAVCYGFNPEGGSKNFNFSTMSSHSEFHEFLRISRNIATGATDGYFLRAESFYNVVSEIDRLDDDGLLTKYSYGGKSLHVQSHGESFFSLLMHRLGGNGVYMFDEPEAALSPTSLLTMLVRIDELVKRNSQFIIATHSPILMTYPNSEIYEITDGKLQIVNYEDTEHFRLTKYFLNNPKKMIENLGIKI